MGQTSRCSCRPAHEATTLEQGTADCRTQFEVPDDPKQINDIPATDARVFEEANIPADRDSLSSAMSTITPPGKVEQVRLMRTALDPQVYTDTYNLLCVYALYLDKVYSLAQSKALAAQAAKAPPAAPSGSAPATPRRKLVRHTLVADTSSSSKPSAAPATTADSHLQQPPAPEGSATNPVFRTTTRLVQVDVVVTDKQGRPIPGLTQSDFTVLQDGKPQQVRVFEPHTASTGAGGSASAVANAPKLPPNTYSNHPNDATADSWTIVLFDLLNTPTADQEYAR